MEYFCDFPPLTQYMNCTNKAEFVFVLLVLTVESKKMRLRIMLAYMYNRDFFV